ncbi:hypothetical protein JHK86_001114 [Glycine max]|nr:hypothetical protein JHK86_001114 [Glycine max]
MHAYKMQPSSRLTHNFQIAMQLKLKCSPNDDSPANVEATQCGIQYSEKRTSLGRIPSNVKKMISAFEGGLGQCMSVVTLEIFRWMVVGVVGFMLATFVALNLREHIMSRGQRWVYIVASIFLLQLVVVVALKANVGTRTEEGQYEKIWETKESKLNTSDNNGDENSRGPFNQPWGLKINIEQVLKVLCCSHVRVIHEPNRTVPMRP